MYSFFCICFFADTHVSSVPAHGARGVAGSRDNKIDFLQMKGGPREGVNFACGYYHSDAALDLDSTPPWDIWSAYDTKC